MAYIDFHPTIHSMGDEACAAAFLSDQHIPEFVDNTVTLIQAYKFARGSFGRVCFPMLTQTQWYVFDSATIEEAYFPKLTLLSDGVFYQSTIKLLLVGDKAGFTTSTCKECANLETLILIGPRAATLQSTEGFKDTPIANGAGYIYVPKTVVDGANDVDGIVFYESATNWSAFAGQFRYIEDYPEILAKVKEVAPWY